MAQVQFLRSQKYEEEQYGYDFLRRLLAAAQIYYLRLNGISYNSQSIKFASENEYQDSLKKATKEIRDDILIKIEIFQTAYLYLLKKYHDANIYMKYSKNEIIKIICCWKNYMTNPKDKELYDGIIKILCNQKINTDYFR